MFAFILLSYCTAVLSVTMKCRALVIRSKKRDVWIWCLCISQMSLTSHQFPICQGYFSVAPIYTQSFCIRKVGSEHSRWAMDIHKLFFGGCGGKDYFGYYDSHAGPPICDFATPVKVRYLTIPTILPEMYLLYLPFHLANKNASSK